MLSKKISPYDLSATDCITTEIISAANGKIALKLIDFSADPDASLRFILKHNKTGMQLFPEVSRPDPDTYLLDFSFIEAFYELTGTDFFYLTVETASNSNVHLYRLCPPSETAGSIKPAVLIEDIYLKDDIKEIQTERIVLLQPAADDAHEFWITLCSRNRFIQVTHICDLRRLSMRGGILKITFDLKPDSLEYVKTTFRFRNKLAEAAIAYDFTTVSTKKHGDMIRIKISLDLHTVTWNGLYWDIYV